MARSIQQTDDEQTPAGMRGMLSVSLCQSIKCIKRLNKPIRNGAPDIQTGITQLTLHACMVTNVQHGWRSGRVKDTTRVEGLSAKQTMVGREQGEYGR